MNKKIKRGSIFLCDLGDQIGSKQSGYRPVLVIQNDGITQKSSEVLVAPLTSKAKEIGIMPTTGYLREKKGRYYAVINLYDSDGKRIQKSHATGLVVKNNKRKAEQFLKKLCVEYDTKKLRFYSNIKVSDYFKQWLVTIQNEVRANTFRSYKGNMERHIIPYFEKKNIELQDLKPFAIS